jgi:hypothetical protein
MKPGRWCGGCNGSAPALLQEDDCIGILAGDEKIASLKPLGDRILIKVSSSEDA